MTVVVVGDNPEVQAIIERRRALGQDAHDEVWEGVYHVAPYAHSRHGRLEVRLTLALAPLAEAVALDLVGPFNLGETDDYRVPDLAVREPGEDAVYLPTALMVIEILSPDDETAQKFGFYAVHGVAEIMVVDPERRTVRLWAMDGPGYRPVEASRVLATSGPLIRAALGTDWS